MTLLNGEARMSQNVISLATRPEDNRKGRFSVPPKRVNRARLSQLESVSSQLPSQVNN
jgi:hypothetical protein